MMVGRILSFRDDEFLRALLNFQGIPEYNLSSVKISAKLGALEHQIWNVNTRTKGLVSFEEGL